MILEKVLFRDNVKWERPVGSITTIFLLINIARMNLNVTTTAFNILFKLYGVLDHKSSVLVAELGYLCRYGEMFGIIICLNTCNSWAIEVIINQWWSLYAISNAIYNKISWTLEEFHTDWVSKWSKILLSTYLCTSHKLFLWLDFSHTLTYKWLVCYLTTKVWIFKPVLQCFCNVWYKCLMRLLI